jgi:hypothetical protein
MPLTQISPSPLRFLGAGAALSLLLLTFLVFGRSTYFSSHAGDGYTLKSNLDTTSTTHCDSQGAGNGTAAGWEFNVHRDGNNHGLSHEQCLSAFTKLFGDFNRVAGSRIDSGKLISFDEVEELSRSGEDVHGDRGLVRGAIVGGEVRFSFHCNSMC